jgi:chitinase
MSKFIGGYYVNWKGFKYAISKLPVECNQIYIFHGKPLGDGAVYFDSPGDGFFEDCKIALKQGRRLLLSVGGAQYGFELRNRQESDNFIRSVKGIFSRITGGLSNVKLGLDWNNFEAEIMPSTDEIIYVSKTLKKIYGKDFVITSPVAPWKNQDKEWAIAMNKAGCLDYVSPQYYDGPSLNNTAYLVKNIEMWVNALGQERIGLGFGILSPTNVGHYWKGQEISECLKIVLQKWPNIRGAFTWELIGDIEARSGFVDIVSKLFNGNKPRINRC